MAHPALNGDKAEHEADTELMSERILIPIGMTLKQRIEDYRFANRHNSVAGAIRHLLEIGLRIDGWEAKKRK